MKCSICGAKALTKKKYNNHKNGILLKSLAKHFLAHYNVLIKQASEKQNNILIQNSLFKGFVHICEDCGYGVMESPPTENALQQYYASIHWSNRSEEVEKATSKDKLYLQDSRALSQIEFVLDKIKNQKISKVLEIGSGAAYASLTLKEKLLSHNPELYVCESGNQWNYQYERHNIKKIANFFPFETKQKFDYIHTSHWLEHVHDLDKTIVSLRDISSASSFLFIEVPNTEHHY